MVVWRMKCGNVIGSLTEDQMLEVDAALNLVLGLEK